jgi:hypothetical protein
MTKKYTGALIEAVRKNCIISDAKDNGIYSMCMLFMRLRNLFKWENGIAPWDEVDPPLLLDWIARKEDEWDNLSTRDFLPVPCGKHTTDPLDVHQINKLVSPLNLCYGAGLGKSLKAVFFLAHIVEHRTECGCRVTVLGKEEAKELDSPFALIQDDTILFRTEPYRYFLWDRVMDTDASNKIALQQALNAYGLLDNCGKINIEKFKDNFDHIVQRDMVPIIRHEVGEFMDTTFAEGTVHTLVSSFPGTVVELLARSTKDALADLHDEGMLGWIIKKRRKSSLGFYVTFVDGFRKILVPEIKEAATAFWETGDWEVINTARQTARNNNRRIADKLSEISAQIGIIEDEHILAQVKSDILQPLGV